MSSTLTQHLPDFNNTFEYLEIYDIGKSSYRSYFSALKDFGRWIDHRSLPSDLPLPVNTIKDYLLDLVSREENPLKPSTIEQRRMAISWLHRMTDDNSEHNPMYQPAFKNISRHIKQIRVSNNLSNKTVQKEPIRIADLKKLCRRCQTDTFHGLRDRALLLIGFSTGLRRAELVNLEVKHIKKNTEAKTADVLITKSKNDPLGLGIIITIDTPGNKFCPLTALNKWLESAQITEGTLFRRIRGKSTVEIKSISPGWAVSLIKQYCEKASFDPTLYAGHSLRRGVLISAIEKGKSLIDVKNHARHKETRTTEHYLGDAVFTKNITKGMFR